MNSEKAREFFSAYYEGSLDSGLTLALEQKFKSDIELRFEYEAFAATFGDLNTLREEEIEIPLFLSDRIATRLEEARQQKKRPFWQLHLPKLATYGLASVAVAGALVGLLMKGKIAEGGSLPWQSGPKTQTDAPAFKFDGSNVTVSYPAHGNHTVVITSGSVVRTLNIDDSQAVEPKLNNANPNAQLFTIKEDSGTPVLVAVPGQATNTSRPAGEGSLGDFAIAIADYYHVPVLLENVTNAEKVKWTLDGVDAVKSANANLEQVNLSADLRTDGMLSINGH